MDWTYPVIIFNLDQFPVCQELLWLALDVNVDLLSSSEAGYRSKKVKDIFSST